MTKLNRNPWTPLRALRTAALSFALVAAGCEGDQGPKGDPGEQGPKGDSATVDPALSTTDKAFAGIGGKEALQGLQNFALESTLQRFVFGEGYRPEDILLGNTSNSTLVRYDVQGNRLSIRTQRTVNFLGFNAPQTYTEIINENRGFLDGMESIFGAPGGPMLSDRTAAVRRQQRLLNPHLILKEVAANPSLARDGGPAVVDGSLHQILVVNDPIYPLSLYVNSQTGKVSKLVTLENHPLLRDVPVEVFYSGWEAATSGGLLFPKQAAIAVDGHLLHAETRKSVTVNGTLDNAAFTFPAGSTAPTYNADDATRGLSHHQFLMSYASIGIPLEGLQTQIQASELAPGVWFLGGGSHNSLVVERADGVVVLEAPLYPERSTAIINWVKNTPAIENKTITHVLATHHHDDHSAGLRAFVAEGAKVVVHEASAAHFRHIFRNPSTIRPDPLAQKVNAPAPMLITVPAGGSITLPDATNPVGAYSVETTHAVDMLMFYVGSAKIAFTSDLYNPGQGGIGNGPKELYKAITQTHNLTVERVTGGHAGTAPIADLAALANQ